MILGYCKLKFYFLRWVSDRFKRCRNYVWEIHDKIQFANSLLKQFSDCRISELEQVRDDKGSLIISYVKKKLDALETSTRKTWRSIGQEFQVSSDDLDMMETDYLARKSPTESLLELLKNREKEPTIREFVEVLIVCGRQDVAAIICNWPWAKYFVPGLQW